MKFRLKQGVGPHVAKGGRVYQPGSIIESSVDLVALLGPEKFELVEGDKNPKKAGARNQLPVTPNSTSAPGGQVHSGLQETKGGVSGPMEPDEEMVDEETLAAAHGEETDESETVSEEGEQGEASDEVDLNTMSVSELKDYAEANEIDLGNAKTKPQILKKLQG